MTLHADTLTVEINQASVGSTPLDWRTAISGHTLDLHGSLLRFTADASLSIGDFVYAGGTFAFQKSDDVYVTPAGASTTVRASLLTVGVSGGDGLRRHRAGRQPRRARRPAAERLRSRSPC